MEKIFSKNNITEREIENVIQNIKDSFSIKSSDETSKILNKIPDFWNKYGKNYERLENVDMGVTTAYIMNKCDLHGRIDLVVKENDENINIVKFIPSNYRIEKFIDFYKYLLSFYAILIKDEDVFKEYSIKNIILHSIKENEVYIQEYDEKNDEDVIKNLNEYVDKVVNEEFGKHPNNCSRCPYKNTICKG